MVPLVYGINAGDSSEVTSMLKKASFFLLVFLVMVASVFAQTPQVQQRNPIEDYSILGKIVIPNGRSVEQPIEVRLEKSAVQVIQTGYTDSIGNFEFRNLTAGSYSVSVNLDGYEPVRQNVD